jgi:archaeosine synthase
MLAEALQTVRIRFPSSLIWAPGISGPDNCALLAWMGVDLFDLARMRHASSLGVLLTESGPRKIEETVDEDFGMEAQCTTWVQAISSTRAAIREGTLRELVERQSMSSPRSVEHLRRHDSMVTENGNTHSVLSSVVSSNRRLRCHTYESRNDPLVLDWRSRVADEHLPPSHQRDILVLLLCSAKKPYKLSKSHIRFRRVLRNPCVHETMVTAPLGLVPRELEDLWPAAHYDIPVSGEWDADELDVIRSMVRRIVSRVGYSVVINHSGIRINIEGTNIIDTRQGDSAGSGEALSRLESAVESAVIDSEGKGAPVHARLEIMMSISRFIHGSDAWLKGASVIGRPPILTINKDGSQLAKWNPRLGRFSFSKSCLPMLDELGGLARVSLRDGVDWIGDIFSSNTESADCSIRSGDELLVFQGGKLIGSARSEAPGWEWPRGPGKLARARHRL